MDISHAVSDFGLGQRCGFFEVAEALAGARKWQRAAAGLLSSYISLLFAIRLSSGPIHPCRVVVSFHSSPILTLEGKLMSCMHAWVSFHRRLRPSINQSCASFIGFLYLFQFQEIELRLALHVLLKPSRKFPNVILDQEVVNGRRRIGELMCCQTSHFASYQYAVSFFFWDVRMVCAFTSTCFCGWRKASVRRLARAVLAISVGNISTSNELFSLTRRLSKSISSKVLRSRISCGYRIRLASIPRVNCCARDSLQVTRGQCTALQVFPLVNLELAF